MTRIFILALVALSSSMAFAARTVTHQHHCPGYFKGLDLCVNYDFPAEVAFGKPVPFSIEIYTADSAYSTERQDQDVEGKLSASLVMEHSGGGHMSMPVTLVKTATGRYNVEGASFAMPGMWGIEINLERAGQPLIKQANLYVYIYPEN
jgi:hypothetical protein